jgi:hypothetical protein
MNIENPKGTESSVSKNTKSDVRRTFLKRASASAVIASLPLKATWAGGAGTGCSVSGNLSGNLSRDCSTAQIDGRSPGGWHKYYKPGSNKYQADSSIPFDGTEECKWSFVFGLGRDPFLVSSFDTDAELWWFLPEIGDDGYSPTGSAEYSNLNRHLVAAYLNAKSGKYGTLTVSAEDYVSGLYDQVTSGLVTQIQIKNAIKSTYNL